MRMTVRQLIAKLKKHNPDAIVVLLDHDSSNNEHNGLISCVEEGEPELCEILDELAVVTIRP